MDTLRKHMHMVAVYSRDIGRSYGLSQKDFKLLEMAAEYHDIGKKIIKDKILFEKKNLSESEFNLIKKHSEIGALILKKYGFDEKVVEAVLHHHEWWNGKGYPSGLRGKEIPLFSRIISIADAFDVMITGRPYKPAVSHIAAYTELLKCAGTQFDPDLVKLFINNQRKDDIACLR